MKGVNVMGEQMEFPDTFEEFAEHYKIIDKEQVYTNGSELIPVFRVKQWLDHKNEEFEKYKSLAQNGQSAIETNKQLSEKILVLLEDIKRLATNSEDGCNYCKYNQPCKGKDCEYYTEGVGLTDEDGNYVNWHWTCKDFDYGTCKKLENTPCNGCNFSNNWEWRDISE